jgi:CRP/FNR family transcriptional regulator, cyclic AMP receptor protein
VTDLLELAANLPEVRLAAGDVLVDEGDTGGTIWVLTQGVLEVRKGAVVVATIAEPGALVGEMSTLNGTSSTATVVAATDCVLRVADDGDAFLTGDVRVMRLVASALATRLAFVTTYLADLRHQYGDAPGLAMVDDVLAELANRQGPAARPGSLRDPDPEY